VLLFPKLTGGAFGRKDGSEAYFNAEVSDDTAVANPLSVLPPEMAPFGVPKEELLLE
jgi:hypothetical protein